MITKNFLWLSAFVFLVIGFFAGQYFGIIPVFASDNDQDGIIDSKDVDDDNDTIFDVDDKQPFDHDNDGIEDDADDSDGSEVKVTEDKKDDGDNEEKVDDIGAVSSISVSGKESSVIWSVVGYSKNGFKIIWSKSSKPTYPTGEKDKYIYLSDPKSRTASLDAFNGPGTYYVRVCEYLGSVCGVYSNEIRVSLGDSNDSKPVSSISVTGSGSSVAWSVDGYSKNGFKIVWSKNSQPTYPTREGDKYIYLSEPNSRNTSLDAFSGSGMYYVRVCEYLGGACGVYSNQIQVSL
ncbi:MAG: hypothetical protein WC870_01790 [Candidatus Paceibacterota bacterium]